MYELKFRFTFHCMNPTTIIVVDAVYKLVCGCIKLCFYSFDLEVGNGVAIFMRDVYTAMRAFICALKM